MLKGILGLICVQACITGLRAQSGFERGFSPSDVGVNEHCFTSDGGTALFYTNGQNQPWHLTKWDAQNQFAWTADIPLSTPLHWGSVCGTSDGGLAYSLVIGLSLALPYHPDPDSVWFYYATGKISSSGVGLWCNMLRITTTSVGSVSLNAPLLSATSDGGLLLFTDTWNNIANCDGFNRLMRFAPDGTIIWSKQLRNSAQSIAGPVYSMVMDGADGCYLAGTYAASCSGAGDGAMLIHVGADGSLDWGRKLAYNVVQSFGAGYGCARAANGDILLCGFLYHGCLARLSPSGDLQNMMWYGRDWTYPYYLRYVHEQTDGGITCIAGLPDQYTGELLSLDATGTLLDVMTPRSSWTIGTMSYSRSWHNPKFDQSWLLINGGRSVTDQIFGTTTNTTLLWKVPSDGEAICDTTNWHLIQLPVPDSLITVSSIALMTSGPTFISDTLVDIVPGAPLASEELCSQLGTSEGGLGPQPSRTRCIVLGPNEVWTFAQNGPQWIHVVDQSGRSVRTFYGTSLALPAAQGCYFGYTTDDSGALVGRWRILLQ